MCLSDVRYLSARNNLITALSNSSRCGEDRTHQIVQIITYCVFDLPQWAPTCLMNVEHKTICSVCGMCVCACVWFVTIRLIQIDQCGWNLSIFVSACLATTRSTPPHKHEHVGTSKLCHAASVVKDCCRAINSILYLCFVCVAETIFRCGLWISHFTQTHARAFVQNCFSISFAGLFRM